MTSINIDINFISSLLLLVVLTITPLLGISILLIIIMMYFSCCGLVFQLGPEALQARSPIRFLPSEACAAQDVFRTSLIHLLSVQILTCLAAWERIRHNNGSVHPGVRRNPEAREVSPTHHMSPCRERCDVVVTCRHITREHKVPLGTTSLLSTPTLGCSTRQARIQHAHPNTFWP